jgi:hypothetical protein
MTLMDAPKFDAARSRRTARAIWGTLGGLFVFLIGMWIFTGRPVDFPWTWWAYWAGERDVNQFMLAVESNDLNRAFGIWNNDYDWRQHPGKYATYPYERFASDWGPDSSDNDYGIFKSHEVVARKTWGDGIIIGLLVNGRKSKPLFIRYDRTSHTLGDSPVELSLDPIGGR